MSTATSSGTPRVGILQSVDYLRHYSKRRHPENPDRLKACSQGLRGAGIFHHLTEISPRRAELDDLQMVHAYEHCVYLRELAESGGGMVDADTYVCDASYEVACMAAGGVMAVVDALAGREVSRAMAMLRPPGHHASAGQAMGFCLFNNVALAARYAQIQRGFGKVLIVDWDAHHGNGTQEIFWKDPTVGYFSVHQYPFYPGTGAAGETGEGPGEGFTVNVPLLAGSGDEQFMAAFEEGLVPLWKRLNPDLVLVSAGFDAHVRDPLAGLNVTSRGFGRLARFVLGQAGEVPVAFALEGGYDLQALSESIAEMAKACLEIPSHD
jgi:acetoin utilization deacetylase AcuC-like enzyme